MPNTIRAAFALPALSADQDTQPRVIAPLSAPVRLPVSLLSPRFFERKDPCARAQADAFFSTGVTHSGSGGDASEGENEIDPEVNSYLYTLEPREWKKQDHYLVLGLQKLRFRATSEDIKAAHRRMILKYHPDKLAAQSDGATDIDAIFKCIQKAHNTLADPTRRMQFDSVDPAVDKDVPDAAEMQRLLTQSPDGSEWYSAMQARFDLEARFSRRAVSNKIQMPSFGTASSPRNKVDAFYAAWFAFDSIRSFEYLDKAEVETLENRDEKRHAERKNKSERMRRKQEDNARLLSFVETAYKLDPRIQAFREEERRAKDAQKRGRNTLSASSKDTLAAESTQDVAAQVAQPSMAVAEAAAKPKQQGKRERKNIRLLVRGDASEESQNADDRQLVDRLLVGVRDDDVLRQIREEMEAAGAGAGARAIMTNYLDGITNEVVKNTNPTVCEERREETLGSHKVSEQPHQKRGIPKWEPADISALIRAANAIPSGVSERWEQIAGQIEKYGTGNRWTASEVAAKCRDIQKMKQVPSGLQDLSSKTRSVPSISGGMWTAIQQEQLQDAMKKYPRECDTGDRWQLIASEVSDKDRDQCVSRVAYLVEQLKSRTEKH